MSSPSSSPLLRRPIATLMAAGLGLAIMAGLVLWGLRIIHEPTGEHMLLGFGLIGVVIVWAIVVFTRAMDA